jgi:hypothetical protein
MLTETPQSELKQAKQQSLDLRQTDEFLSAIIKPGYAEKEKASKPSPLESSGPRQLNGRPKMPRVDSFSRFSEPPAPPPQQPLPEKPDAPPRGGPDGFSPLKRSDTDKPKSASSNSPISRDSSQILALIESLTTTKRELETQGTRIKELEDLLRQEKAARESAEEKVKKLEMTSLSEKMEPAIAPAEHDTAASSTQESLVGQEHEVPETSVQTNGSILPSEVPTASDSEKAELSTEAQLQRRLESVMEQMDEMSKQMAAFKERAEKADNENGELRQSLAEMIETIRKERAEKASSAVTDSKSHTQAHDSSKVISGQAGLVENGAAGSKTGDSSVECFESASKRPEIDVASTAIAQWQRRHYLEEASPYASMLGVVLLGVGLMAYLNGWQKMDK